MVHDDYLPSPQQLLRDDHAANGVWYAAAGVADDVGIAFFESEGAGGVYGCQWDATGNTLIAGGGGDEV